MFLRKVYTCQIILILTIGFGECWSSRSFGCRRFSQQQQRPRQRVLSLCNEEQCLTTRTITSGLVSLIACFVLNTEALAATEDPPTKDLNPPLVWHLQNGDVELTQRLSSFKSLSLQNPVLLGSGGGGAVFSTNVEGKSGKDLAIKVSWIRSALSVKRECETLNKLEEKGTRNVIKCLGIEQYPQDTRRVMIALEPVVDNTIATISGVNKDVQTLSVQAIVKTLVDMLAANVVTTDVQPLMNRETGDVLFIDMTEAQIMSTPPTFLDLALASSFCTEMASLIPESMREVASATLLEELNQAQNRGIRLPNEILDLLHNLDVMNISV